MTREDQNKILDAKIESNVNQYKVDRLNAEISAFSSGDLNKYEFLKRIYLNYKPNALDRARFEFSPLDKTFSTGLDKTAQDYQEEGVIKLLKDIKDGLSNRINIPPKPPPKDTKLNFDDINKIKENQELNEIKKRIDVIFYMSDDILRDGINIEKMLLEINYHNIRHLNNKLKDNNLSVAELKKTNDDIVKNKNKISERKQTIYDYEKVLEKRIKTDQNK